MVIAPPTCNWFNNTVLSGRRRNLRVFGDTSTEVSKARPPRQVPGLPGTLLIQEAEECVRWILRDEATRPKVGRGTRQKVPLVGRNICWQGGGLRFRGSDRTERAAVSVSILIHAGASEHNACVDIAFQIEEKLGKSRRGRRPGKHFHPSMLADKAETVRGLYKKFWRVKLGALPPEQIVQFWFWSWWHQKYTQTHPDAFPISGEWRISDIRARQEAAIKALGGQSPD